MAVGTIEDGQLKSFKEIDNRTAARIVCGDENATPIPIVSDSCSTATPVQIPISATSVTLLAANPNRLGAIFHNDTSRDAFITYGATSSTSLFTDKLEPGDRAVIDQDLRYTGVVSVIWQNAGGGGGMMVTECS